MGSERIAAAARRNGGKAAILWESPLAFCYNDPEEHDTLTRAIHAGYVAAGAQCVTADAFLAPFAPDRAVAVQQVRRAVALARSVAGERPVFLSLGPSNVGGADAVFADLARAGADAGTTLILFETFVRADEAARAVRAAAQATGSGGVALAASLVVDAEGRTLAGREPAGDAARWLIEAGAGAVGLNCQPPDLLPGAVAALAAVARPAQVPVLVRPSAGIPLRAGETWVYPWTPRAWAEATNGLRRQGPTLWAAAAGRVRCTSPRSPPPFCNPDLDSDFGGNSSCE
jgi:methionine synthase I (cobalamin-dependent)